MREHMKAAGRTFTFLLSSIFVLFPEVAGAQTTNGGSFFDDLNQIDTKRWYVSDGWVNGGYQGCAWSRNQVRTANGRLQLRLAKAKNPLRAYECAEIRTHARLGYGLYEARIRSAAGAGLNTAMFTYSGPPITKVHDELDFEFLGKVPNQVQTNFWVNQVGNNEQNIAVPGGAASAFNHYAIDWSPDSVKWYINGTLVRSESGKPLPVTPGQFFLTLWSGSASIASWLGTLPATTRLAVAEVDWVAYSAPGTKCLFPKSISCTRP